jgi:hypothetical protein
MIETNRQTKVRRRNLLAVRVMKAWWVLLLAILAAVVVKLVTTGKLEIGPVNPVMEREHYAPHFPQ